MTTVVRLGSSYKLRVPLVRKVFDKFELLKMNHRTILFLKKVDEKLEVFQLYNGEDYQLNV